MRGERELAQQEKSSLLLLLLLRAKTLSCAQDESLLARGRGEMRHPLAAAALHEALLGYLAFYRTNWSEGKFVICNDDALKSCARRCLASDAACCCSWEGGSGRWDVYSIAETCSARKGQAGSVVFGKLSKAFEFLELLCVNLFVCPWRKEIKSLKTFTGNFVYYVQSVLPDGVVKRLLEEIGYVATTATEFSLVRKPNEAEAEQAAFDLFLARIECEDIFEMAKGVRDSDFGDILQKRAQKYWPPEGGLVRKPPPSWRKELVMTGRSEMQGCCSSQQATLTEGQLAFDAAANGGLGLRFTADESQPPIPEFTSDPNTTQSPGRTSENTCIKSTDSEDFLTKYSDIVIGQKPLHFARLSPKASENQTPTTGLISTMLRPPANGKRPPTLPSPDASGPQALAILNNATLERGICYGCRSQGSSKEVVELKINEAMKCLSVHRSDSTDDPKELKGNAVQQGNTIISACPITSGEETCETSTSTKLKTMEDSIEGLVHPIMETARPDLSRSKIGIQEFSHSRMQRTDLPGGAKGSFSVDLYSSSQLCNVIGCECPSVGSDYDQLLVGFPGAHGAGEGFGETSRSTLAIPPGAQCGSPLAENPCRSDPEGCPLHSSFADEVGFDTCIVKMNDTDMEDYVIVSKEQ